MLPGEVTLTFNIKGGGEGKEKFCTRVFDLPGCFDWSLKICKQLLLRKGYLKVSKLRANRKVINSKNIYFKGTFALSDTEAKIAVSITVLRINISVNCSLIFRTSS